MRARAARRLRWRPSCHRRVGRLDLTVQRCRWRARLVRPAAGVVADLRLADPVPAVSLQAVQARRWPLEVRSVVRPHRLVGQAARAPSAVGRRRSRFPCSAVGNFPTVPFGAGERSRVLLGWVKKLPSPRWRLTVPPPQAGPKYPSRLASSERWRQVGFPTSHSPPRPAPSSRNRPRAPDKSWLPPVGRKERTAVR